MALSFDALSNAVSLIGPHVTLVGTAVILFLWASAEYLLRKPPVQWVAKGGREVWLRGLGTLPRLALVGALLLLWIPREYDYANKDAGAGECALRLLLPPNYSPPNPIAPPRRLFA